MKTEETVPKPEVPFDPVLFAAVVPSRKPTAKDKADVKERPGDAIERKEHAMMEDIAKDLVSFSIVTHGIVSN